MTSNIYSSPNILLSNVEKVLVPHRVEDTFFRRCKMHLKAVLRYSVSVSTVLPKDSVGLLHLEKDDCGVSGP